MNKRLLYSIAQRHFTGSLQYVSKDELYKALDEYVDTEKKEWLDNACKYIRDGLGFEIGEEEYEQWEQEFRKTMDKYGKY